MKITTASPSRRHPSFVLRSALAALCAAFAATAASAADVYWATPSGSWNTPNGWFDADTGGNPVNPPAAADNANIVSGSVLIDAGFVPITTNASVGYTAGETASVTVANGALWMPTGTTLVTGTVWNSGTFFVGRSGTGFVTIEAGGTLRSAAGNADGNGVRIGDQPGAYGKVTIQSGGIWESGGMHIGGTGATGIVHVEAGGTLTLRNATTYIGRYDGSYGEVIVDGYFATGGNSSGAPAATNGTYYIPIGYVNNSVGVFTIGATGIVKSGQFDLAKGATATGTLTIAGSATTSGVSVIGNPGKGTATITASGTWVTTGHVVVGSLGSETSTLNVDGLLNFSSNSNLILGGYATTGPVASGTAPYSAGGILNVTGTIRNANTFYIGNWSIGDSTFNLAQGARLEVTANSWYSRQTNGLFGGTNVANIAGTWDTGGYLVVGNSFGYSELNIATSGTVIAHTTGIRIGYGGATTGMSDAKVELDGYMGSDVYFIVAHWGNAYMHIGTTGTLSAATYISVGQGDYTGAGFTHADGSTYALSSAVYESTYSGTMHIDGYAYAGSYFRVGNKITGVLELSTTGTIETRTYFAVSENTSALGVPTGTATIAGRLSVGSYLVVGANANNEGHLDLKTTSDVTVNTYYRQNARSTLSVELDLSRAPDPVNPAFATPLFTANGAATLSGTLHAYGNAIATIPQFQWDSNNYSRAGVLTGRPVFRASGGITGDYDTVVIDGLPIPSNLPDFIRGGGLKVNEGGPLDTRYDVGYGLAWRAGVASAHGTFTVDSGYTFNTDIQLADRPGLTFASGWDGKSLTKAGDGTLILSVNNSYTGDTLVTGGTLQFAGPATVSLTSLTNNSIIDLGSGVPGASGYRTLNATSLAGSGTFKLVVDIAAGVGDRVNILGDATGTHRLFITGIGAIPTGDEPVPVLLSVGGVNGGSFDYEGTGPSGAPIINGEFDYGVFNYRVQQVGNNVVIVNTGLHPEAFGPINGVLGAQNVLWFDQQDSLSRRFGELRAPRSEHAIGADIWARGHAAQATIGGGSTDMRRSNVDLYGFEVGADYTWQFDGERAVLGLYAGYGTASQDFKNVSDIYAGSSTGDSDMLGLGVYAAWLDSSGWFANATLSAARYKNTFDAIDGSNNHVTGDYKENGIGVMVEAGRRIIINFSRDPFLSFIFRNINDPLTLDAAGGWFVEPAIQGSLTRLTRADYLTGGQGPAAALSVHGSDISVSRLRGIVRGGRAWPVGAAGRMEIVGRLAGVREDSSGGQITIGGDANRWRPNLDGTRFEAGVSVFWQPALSSQVYFDYEFASGDNYDKPWSVSLGFRLSL